MTRISPTPSPPLSSPIPPPPPPQKSEPKPEWPIPKLKLRIDDLTHAGVDVFFDAVQQPAAVLRRAVDASVRWLYPTGKAPTHVEEILLVLAPMEGVAHTTGTRTHKEIWLSLDYVYSCRERAEAEIAGVLVHEMVHCFQRDAAGTCPGGLIEGIADYVRLNEGLAPPHWKQQEGNGWDSGYETTAYFLNWIEAIWGQGSIHKLNACLDCKAYAPTLFVDVTGIEIADLWASYCVTLNTPPDEDGEGGEKAPHDKWPMPKFVIRVDDLAHQGADVFFGAVKPKEALTAAVMASFNHLYTLEDVPRHVKEIMLVLRSMDGVAYTTGTKYKKEIHYSLDYIKATRRRAREEIMGVLVHEVVHCYQYDGNGSCPGGLVEGMADYVRLQEGLNPPHWQRKGGQKWDMGYDGTAYFLDWIEETVGEGTVRKLNACMKNRKYRAKIFEECCGKSVDALWAEYCASLESKEVLPPIPEEPAAKFVVQQDK